nr:PREDICTED: uncharacterized protein LOC105662750 [Megachile rotundata]
MYRIMVEERNRFNRLLRCRTGCEERGNEESKGDEQANRWGAGSQCKERRDIVVTRKLVSVKAANASLDADTIPSVGETPSIRGCLRGRENFEKSLLRRKRPRMVAIGIIGSSIFRATLIIIEIAFEGYAVFEESLDRSRIKECWTSALCARSSDCHQG